MKRIVECPSCKTKMQIFDIGKEINQKCPRCQNSFEIHPEETKTPNKKETAVAKKTDEKKITVKPVSKKTIKKSPATAKNIKTAADKKPDGTISKPLTSTKPANTPKPAPKPVAAAPLPEPHPAGFSGMQFIILIVLLLVAIIIQIVFAKNQMKQMSVVNDNLKVIHSKL